MVRNITLKDTTGSIKTALWEKSSTSPIKVGSRVRLTFMATKHHSFVNAQTIQSTSMTNVEVMKTQAYDGKHHLYASVWK